MKERSGAVVARDATWAARLSAELTRGWDGENQARDHVPSGECCCNRA